METFAPQPTAVETTLHGNQKESKSDTTLTTRPQTPQLKKQNNIKQRGTQQECYIFQKVMW